MLAMLGSASAVSATDATHIMAQKTVLKTSHANECSMPSGKLRKDCAHIAQAKTTPRSRYYRSSVHH
jgi:hypothetical protein